MSKPEMEWNIDGTIFVVASKDRIDRLRALEGAPHIMFACLCGHSYWTAKNIALSANGRYNGARNIFYNGKGPECSCPASNLRCIESKQ